MMKIRKVKDEIEKKDEREGKEYIRMKEKSK